MKIVVCGSMSSARKMVEIKKELMAKGHEVLIPKNAEKYASKELSPESAHESTQNKIKHDLIRDYYQKISNADAIVVVNETKNNIENYVGGNSFLEMGFAHVLNKKIYLLNPVPNMQYRDEIEAMQPEVLNGNMANLI